MKENCFQLYWDTTEILFFTIFVKAAAFPCFDPVVPYHRKTFTLYVCTSYPFRDFVQLFQSSPASLDYHTGLLTTLLLCVVTLLGFVCVYSGCGLLNLWAGCFWIVLRIWQMLLPKYLYVFELGKKRNCQVWLSDDPMLQWVYKVSLQTQCSVFPLPFR